MSTATAHTPRHARRLAAFAAVALTAAAAACSSTHTNTYGEHDDTGTGVPSGASIATLPPLPSPWNALDRNDPAAVAVATVQAVFDWHPERGDTGPENAARRAAPLFSVRGAEDYKPYPIPRPTWQAWMDEKTTVTAQTAIGTEQHPADTAAQWQRKTATTLTITTPGKPPITMTVISLITTQKQPVWTTTQLAHLQ
ncbi:hypothetical protein ACIRRA_39935 [Nocardia sp. NPDC101769]|uniref:hypothetical protein n=1 Tax=Nocardia sp. NPDC101769 TaxID=3364333 RepID=UPI0038274B35